jgi:hypothetical protein
MSIFDKLVKNNTLILFFVLFVEDRKNFHHQVINARQFFLILMNAAKHKTKKKENISAVKSRSRAISEIFSFVDDINNLYENQFTSTIFDLNQDFQKLLNFCQGSDIERKI